MGTILLFLKRRVIAGLKGNKLHGIFTFNIKSITQKTTHKHSSVFLRLSNISYSKILM